MVNKTTTAQLLKKPVQYGEEATEGSTPNVSFTACGPVQTLSIKKDGGWVEIAQLGPEDLIALLQGMQKYELQLKMRLTASTFVKYGVNAANYGTPAGTISASLTLIWSIYLNGVENYLVANGCRCRQVTFNFEVGKPHEVTMDFVAMNIVAPSASAPTATLTSTFPTGPVWGWLDGGSGPVTWAGTALNAQKVNITINRNTKEDYILGQSGPYGSQSHGRRIAGDITNLWTETSLESDNNAGTARTLVITLKSASSTLTISNTYAANYNRDSDADADTSVVETCNVKSLSCTIT